jgi:hypothetical protein
MSQNFVSGWKDPSVCNCKRTPPERTSSVNRTRIIALFDYHPLPFPMISCALIDRAVVAHTRNQERLLAALVSKERKLLANL